MGQSLTLYPPSPTPPSIQRATVPAESSPQTESNNFLWTEQRLRAVALLADGRYTQKEVAQMIGTSPSILKGWQRNPVFQNQLDNNINEYKDRILSTTIAQKHYRIKSLQDRHELLNRIISQRQKQVDPTSQFYNPEFAHLPGLDTGLVLPSLTSTKVGMHDYLLTHEAKIDNALLTEFRSIEKQAAEETGQWSETHNINILQKAYIGIDINQV